ncbi:MAG: phytanoyl-CoA dioxygenase family protein [Pseudomonadota bacterium]
MDRITDEHIAHYRQHGYAIVEKFLTDEELTGARENIDACMPGWVDYCDDPTLPKPESQPKMEGSYPVRDFPYRGRHLNAITMHPELRQFAQSLMGDEEIYCEQSHLSFKYKGHRGDRDQHMHMDYGNHTLVYPPDRSKYWQTAYLLYYTEVTENHAPTAVVSWEHYKEGIHWPASWSREKRPELYEKEVKVIVPAGSLLIYSMRTFHRGTPFLGDVGRIGQFVTYAPKNYRWLGIVGWPANAIRQEFREWVGQATIEELTTLGFPAPGDVYWTEETLAGVGARYPKLDMTPYQQAMLEQ